jgi:hypothetical protein
MKKALVFVLALLALSAAFAIEVQNDSFGGVSFYRAYPGTSYVGQQSWVTIAIFNTENIEKNITLVEQLGNAEFNKTGATATNTTFGVIWTYEWSISLGPMENTSVSYWIAPKSAGKYVFSPSKATVNGQAFRLKSAVIEVGCMIDAVCGAGENYANCPQDCASGSNDGVCDCVSDGKCDPDCTVEGDSDCISANQTAQANASANITGGQQTQQQQIDSNLIIWAATALALLVFVLELVKMYLKKR